jgi:hypothetical protein
MPRQPVRVLSSPLTGRIYALTSYTVDDDGSNLVARIKYDVTHDVRALITEALQTNGTLTCLCSEAVTRDVGCICGAAVRQEFLARRTR